MTTTKYSPESETWRIAEQLFLASPRDDVTWEQCLELAADVVAHAARKLADDRVLAILRVTRLARGVLAVLLMACTSVASAADIVRVGNAAQLDAAIKISADRPILIIADQCSPPRRPVEAKQRPRMGESTSGVVVGSGAASAGWGGGPVTVQNQHCGRRLILVPIANGRAITSAARYQ